MTTALSDFDRWVLRPAPRTAPLLRLVCVPYAGGGTAAFQGWSDLLPDTVEPWFLRLPGRESRFREEPRTDVPVLVKEAAAVLGPALDGPYALFGHSLGALIAFELARELRRSHRREPVHLAVSARSAPHLPLRHTVIHQLPDDLLLKALDQRFNAIPPAIRDDPQLRALYLPVLRADVTLLETYAHTTADPLSCPVTAYGGEDDPEFGPGELEGWHQHTAARFRLRTFPGGHFFLNHRRAELVADIVEDLYGAMIP
ncbi:alpha/beta fold hydrolase [Streptomyces sp. TRM 70361]|uniref:thioesterase II family protein n=1 Tax=Streptomyces sp. TRM 70361 TaxID=3116553 RepID=UPI002E7C22BB|nr:alpha/beta fold hydrolase [Streptomyces sp. TRM 70361]MEE1940373.1 alpha/beta fold hydrolase [Streptomyces sp. TRM 70361]